ncbi:hypothetical protein BDV40DRAFT_280756 [Aspergillus tamarii]|uniref:Uncharacterized protein n=1 Tax=Aspergillus tamarii TaxID=41984 RepID=A0A5N6UDB5_ASPTM|nr:hypothetical protein BDV40DRAFT_280756 [Aspergillus tamarii]
MQSRTRVSPPSLLFYGSLFDASSPNWLLMSIVPILDTNSPPVVFWPTTSSIRPP